MRRLAAVMIVLPLLAGATACSHLSPQAGSDKPGLSPAGVAPATQGRTIAPGEIVEREWSATMFENGLSNLPIDLRDVPPVPESNRPDNLKARDRRPETPVPPHVMDKMRADSMLLPPSDNVQLAETAEVSLTGTATAVGEGIDASQSCLSCATVPPDPEIAVGPDHIIVVTNVAFAVYSKSTGALLSGPTDFDQFFAGTGCTGTFDPNALYDESADRFIVGVDGNGTRYCIAATQGSDPTLGWNRYSFQTISKRNEFFDYPHAGVGRDAIYMGANIFRGQLFLAGRVWAVNKTQLYAGTALQVVGKATGVESTPQPMNLHGWNQGTWPASGPHYILTDDQFNGATYGVWSWSNPFGPGGGTFTDTGTFNLNTATGITAGQAINAPQQGGNPVQGNDWRVQDADFRNGFVWTTNTIACNPGGGSVNCLRWAQVNPATRAVVQAGVFSSSGQHRIFGDVAANHCNDAAVGYTKTSSSMSPAVWVTGRQSGDTPGTLQAEVVCRNGDGVYTSFDGSPHRWGDYSEMTVDPNGEDFWYVGEYSKPTQSNPSFTTTKWGTFICKVSFSCSAP